MVENDVISLTNPLYDLDNSPYLVEKIDKSGLNYSMLVVEYSDIYTWESESLQPDPPAPPSDSAPGDIQDFSITKTVVIQDDGTAVSSFNGSYTVPESNFLYVSISLKLSSDSVWKDISTSSDGKFIITNLKQGSSYDVRLISVDGDTIAPAMPLGFSVNDASGHVEASWFENTTDFDLKGYYLYRDGIQIDVGKVTSFSDFPPLYETDYSYQLSA